MKVKEKQRRERHILEEELARNLEQYKIKGTDDDWENALANLDLRTVKKGSGLLSVKSIRYCFNPVFEF